MDLKYLRHALFYFFTAVLSLILIFYIGYHLFDGFAQNIVTTPAEKVTQNHTLTLDGYLLRQERLIYSQVSGEVGYLYSDGVKIPSGVEIAHVYAVTNPTIRAQILELDEKIALYEASSAISGITASDTTVIDRQIQRLYLLLGNAMRGGDAEYVYRKQNELLILLNQRKIITGAVTDYKEIIAELKAKKEILTESLSGVTESVISTSSGWFYGQLDGYENIFTANSVEDLTVREFESMMNAEPMTSSGMTENGYPIGKILVGYRWYVACLVDYDLNRHFQVGKHYDLVFPYNSDTAISMLLAHAKNDMDAGKVLLVFESGENPENFHYLRMQTVQVVRQTYEGFRVPVSAVRMVNGVQGVYVLSGSYVRFRAIEPLYEDDGYLIAACAPEAREDGIAWLSEYEEIIIEGKDMYDGKIIK